MTSLSTSDPTTTLPAHRPDILSGTEIREARQKAGITQKALGQRLGITQTAVSNYECGNWRPLPHIMRAIRRVFGMDPPALGVTLDGASCIELTSGRYVTLDKLDFERFSGRVWREDGGRGYAKTEIRLPDGRPKIVYLHRLIMDAPPGWDVHHKDHNRRNNQRSNLVLIKGEPHKAYHAKTRQQYRGPFHRTYKGVYLRKDNGKYQAKLAHMGNQGYLGQYSTAEEAARVVDARILELWGENAYFNMHSTGAKES